MSNDNPRQFWCNVADKYDQEQCFLLEAYLVKPKDFDNEMGEGLLHVIEYSAVEKLQAEVERLKQVVEWNLSNNDEYGCEFLGITIVRDQNKKLEAEIAELKKCLSERGGADGNN